VVMLCGWFAQEGVLLFGRIRKLEFGGGYSRVLSVGAGVSRRGWQT